MFSGGLDSVAGAVETANTGGHVVLVSHRSVSTASARQKKLFHAPQKRFPSELAELIARRKAARQVKVKETVMLSALIFHRKGEPIRKFRKSWATACTKAGISRLFHDLRRSACRNMNAAGVAQVTAMQVSGHKTDSMFRRYAIVSETDLRAALRATQQYLATVKENVVAMASNG
jgi:integrase